MRKIIPILLLFVFHIVMPTQAITADWQAVIKNKAPNYFKDPESVQFKFNTSPGSCLILEYGKIVYEGQLCGTVVINAKNGFGGYVGFEPYFFIINDGQLSRFSRQAEFQEQKGISVEYGTRDEHEKRTRAMNARVAALGPSKAERMNRHALALGAAKACGVDISKDLAAVKDKIKKDFPDDFKFYTLNFMAQTDIGMDTADKDRCPAIKEGHPDLAIDW